MEKLVNGLQKLLAPVANAFSRNKVIQAISRGFTSILPVLIVGSIFSLFSGLNIGGYQEFISNNGLYDILMIGLNLTINMIAVYSAFTIAYQMTKLLDPNGNALAVGILSLVNFLIVTPLASVVGEDGSTTTYIDMTNLGSKGLIAAILISILTAYIYNFFILKKITIKMPQGTPPNIGQSFASIIPAFATVILALIVNVLFSNTNFGSIHGAIYAILGMPFASLQGSIITWIVLNLLASLFWFFGIHGGMVTMPFMMVLFLQPTMENINAFAAGQPLPNAITFGIMGILMLGGIGSTLSLVILMAFSSKSSRFKTLGRLALVPGMFGINEPIVFGMPLVLNPIMFTPFLLVPQLNIILLYWAMTSGLVGYPRMMWAFGTPVFLDGFLQLGVAGIIVQIVLIFLDMLVYYPFFKIEDSKAYEEEKTVSVPSK